MLWIITGLLTALFTALSQFAAKLAGRNVSAPTVTVFGGLSGVVLIPLGLALEGWTLAPEAWILLAASVGLNGLLSPLYYRAIRLSELSVVGPLTTLTPALMLLTSPLIAGETVPLAGAGGIGLVVSGAYLLNVRDVRAGWARPLVALWDDPGGRLMLWVNLGWSILANIDAVGARTTSPVLWGGLVQLSMAFMLAPLLVREHRASPEAIRRALGPLFGVALTVAATSVMQLVTMTLTYASYAIAFKRLSALIAILLGGLVLRERGFGWRLVAGLAMCAGVALIALS